MLRGAAIVSCLWDSSPSLWSLSFWKAEVCFMSDSTYTHIPLLLFTIQFTHLQCVIQFFCIFARLCKHHHNQFWDICITPKETLYSLPVRLIYFLSLRIYLLWLFSIGEWNYATCGFVGCFLVGFFFFSDWLPSLNIVFSEFIYVAVCISTSFLFITK